MNVDTREIPLSTHSIESHRDYWRRRLEGAPTLLELPTDRPRTAVQGHRGASLRLEVPAGVVERLERLGRGEGATLFMTLLAAYQVLLHRYSGQEDVVVGTPMAGVFQNLLPVRTRVGGEDTFRAVLARVRAGLTGDDAHAEYPFESMVEDLGLGRDASHAPLVQAAFVHLDRDPCGLGLEGLELRREWVDGGTATWDVLLSLQGREDGGLDGVLEYDRDLFDAGRMERMAGHWGVMLEGIVEDAGRRVWELPLLTRGERERVLVEWNRTEREYPGGKCLHRLFEEQVLRTPGAVAVEFGEERLTYRELDGRANGLARALMNLGVLAGGRVAVLMERSPDFVVAVLGILKAGCAYVPLDSKSPQDRLIFMIQDVGAAAVVARDGAVAEGLSGCGTRILTWASLMEGMGTTQPAPPPVARASTDLAYVMYTSGSTGVPKGVSVPHRAVARLVFGNDYLPFGPGETFALLSSTAFDASTLELWGALLHGAKLAVGAEGVLGREELAGFLARHRVSCLWLTAAFFNVVVDEYPEVLEPVRHCMTGGDALSVPHVCKALRALPGMRLVNGYGPTECTTFATTFEIPRDFKGKGGSVPIGRPIGNTRLYLLGRHGEPVPVGVPGEIHLAGDGLAEGYWGRPDLTSERFVKDPFSVEPGARLYRTGDWGRFREDGNVEFLGRMDLQVKLRGFRIELGEVESTLAADPVVGQCVVVAREDAPGDMRLVGYVVVREGRAWDEEGVRGRLRARLPEYMVPAAFVCMERLPLNANGKVDRKALPRPVAMASPINDHEAPRSEVERQLAGAWAEVLGMKAVGVHDNFFEMGGHSLKAIELTASLGRMFGRRLPVMALYQAPTVARMARWLEGEAGRPKLGDVVLLEPDSRGPSVFCLHGMPLHLARALKSECRVHGVPCPVSEDALEWLGTGRLGLTVEALAARCVALIREVQGTGPYHLMGFSFGGVLAFEVALQLEAAGERVGMLCLLDAFYPAGTRPARFPMLRMLAGHAARFLKVGPRHIMDHLAVRRASAGHRREDEGQLRLHANPQVREQAQRILDASWTLKKLLAKRYVARTYAGDVLLVRATEMPHRSESLPEPTHGWGAVVSGRLQVLDLPCSHLGVLEPPHVEVVAREFQDHFARGT